jgi:uncharacterized protein (TIGR03083 family)
MPGATAWIGALRISKDRFAALVGRLDGEASRRPSYDSEWSIAQVASHLGSQAEIYTMFLDAGLSGRHAPGMDQCRPIWDQWDNRTPERQVSDSVGANEKFLVRMETLSGAQAASFALSLEGADLDLAGFAASRLSEFALHTWDIAVALDPEATIPADAVDLLVDTLPAAATRAGTPSLEHRSIVVRTAAPERSFVLTTGPSIVLSLDAAGGAVSSDRADPAPDTALIHLPGEALVRLVYGRLDPAHTPPELADDAVLPVLRGLFPGF